MRSTLAILWTEPNVPNDVKHNVSNKSDVVGRNSILLLDREWMLLKPSRAAVV